MKTSYKLLLACTAFLALASTEPPVSKRPLVFNGWPPKSGKQLARNPIGAANKQRTLMVQIRSDQPVPLILKGRQSHTHGHHHAHLHGGHGHAHAYTHAHNLNLGHAHLLNTHALTHPHTHLRGPSSVSRPMKLSAAPVYRKPLKIKLNNAGKPKSKPTFGYDKPFKYEKPSSVVAYSELQNLPALDTHDHFISDHFAPIYTVPAPNLAALHDNQLHDEPDTAYLPPQTQSEQHTVQAQTYLPPKGASAGTQYQVVEDSFETNDQTLRDAISGSQKFFAPDPDPSLPTTKIRPATESFNQPSNNKPLPADVQSNHLPAQPIVQIVGAQAAAQTAPQIYPIQFTQQAALQPLITANVAAVQPAAIPIYNPTYLVTQSNQLYSQHQQQQQQLFKPSEHIVETGYVNADLTQEVASNGQILQAAKDPHHNIHPVLDAPPQYAALIAAPVLGEEAIFDTAPFHLTNVAAGAASAATAPESGFVVSNYYSNPQDSTQLLQAYAEEEARHQQLEADQAAFELQQQQQQQHLAQLKQEVHEQQLQAQQQQQQEQHLAHLKQEAQVQQLQAQQHLQQQQQQFQLEFQQQFPQLQQHHQQQQHQFPQLQQHQQQQKQLQQQHRQQQQQQQQQQQKPLDSAAAAFEEHQRLVQQQLGNTPLRIFVPDDDATPETQRLQKRSDDVKTKKGTVVDDNNESNNSSEKNLFQVSSSVEVSGERQEETKN